MAALRRPLADRRFRRLLWLIVAAIGWAGVVALGVALYVQTPPRAGFDLALILEAGRRVAAGTSPYLVGAVGVGTQVESLFYSYPPPVAQAAAVLASIPDAVVLVATGIGATAGFGVVAAALARRGAAPGAPAGSEAPTLDVVLPALALAPFTYPFAIALLFGNVDAWFPLAYGVLLLAVVAGGTRAGVAGGVALGLVTLAKLHPGSLIGWLIVRGIREGRAWSTRVALAAAVATVVVVCAVSLAIGGVAPWTAYLDVLRAGTAADFVSRLNIGPASQLALAAGDATLAVRIAPVVTGAALLLTVAAAWLVRSSVVSLAIAAVASLVVSPITWFHYPVAMLPFAVAAWVAARGTPRAGPTAGLIVAALVVAALAISEPVAVWLAVSLVVAACAVAVRSPAGAPAEIAADPSPGR